MKTIERQIDEKKDELIETVFECLKPLQYDRDGSMFHYTDELKATAGVIYRSIENALKSALSANPSKERQIIQKQDELIEGVNRINEFLHKAIEHGRGDVAEWEETYDIKLNKIKVAESGLSALKSELKDEEQPITDSPKEILQHYEIYKSINSLDNCGRTYEDIIDQYLLEFPVSKYPVSLKAQKAQPGDEWDKLEDFNTPLDKPLEL